MLKPLTEKEFDRYIDFAYELALDQTRSGYPTYTDGIKTREDFLNAARRALARDDEEILLFIRDGQAEGWLHYQFEAAERYLQTCVFNVRTGTENALAEFLEYIKKRFPGYEIYLGFPKRNRKAVAFLCENGFERIEESFNDVLALDIYEPLPEAAQIFPVTGENFALFRALHDQGQEAMYWNSDRLLNALDAWKIYIYEKNGCAAGAIYYMDGDIMLEIFGVDFPDGVYDDQVFKALLAKALNEGKKCGGKYFCFFTDKECHPAALSLGFHSVGEYVCFRKRV